jgi:hypothetical protein
MKMIRLYFIVILVLLVLSWGCEKRIDPELPEAPPLTFVDAWITNTYEPQIIRLNRTLPYFENSEFPGITGADVRITDNENNEYVFIESEITEGEYTWAPPSDTETFGKVGNQYILTISYDNTILEAISQMNRVPEIDSISFRYEEGNSFFPESYFAGFYAVDPIGPGDTYWIKAYKNGVYLNKPDEINIAYDAGFSAGSEVDGITFIQPIRDGINPFEQDENDDFLSPYAPGDSVYVEIHSISNFAFYYLTQVRVQIDRPGGFAELFATPLSNVVTNVVDVTNNEPLIGFFNVAAVSSEADWLDPDNLPTE